MVGLPMIESALAGFNTSLVCYGQVLLLLCELVILGSEKYFVACLSVLVSAMLILLYALNIEWHREDVHHVGAPRCDGGQRLPPH
jgi:hypothetical protein